MTPERKVPQRSDASQNDMSKGYPSKTSEAFTMQKADKIDLNRLARPPLKQTFKNPTFQLYHKPCKTCIYLNWLNGRRAQFTTHQILNQALKVYQFTHAILQKTTQPKTVFAKLNKHFQKALSMKFNSNLFKLPNYEMDFGLQSFTQNLIFNSFCFETFLTKIHR